MKYYHDISEWNIEELCNNIRERIAESKKPIPPKVKKHGVSIYQRTGEGCYRGTYHEFFHFYPIKSREHAERILNSCSWLEKIGDNMWIEIGGAPEYYECKDGTMKRNHYFIEEYDYEEYEDGKDHVEYSEGEIQALKDTLFNIEKGLAYMRAYDHAEDQGSFGGGAYVEYANDELEKFNEEYTEELPDGYYDD